MEILNFKIKNKIGKHNSLDKAYNYLVRKIVSNNSDGIDRWETYNVIMNELLTIGKENYFEEFKYRLTDGENPNVIILDIINRDDASTSLIWILKNRVETYLEEDNHKRFFD